MDGSEVECELESVSVGCSVQPTPDSEHRPERENLSATSEGDSSEGENRLVQDAASYSLGNTRVLRSQKRKLESSSASISSSDDAPSFPTLKEQISEFVKRPFRNWRRFKETKTRKKRSPVERKKRCKKRTTTKPKQYAVPLEERRRRLLDQGIKFPFTPLKDLSLKQYSSYEQFVLGGFLNHVKNLKCERSLKQSLKDMDEDENLENENFGMREYSYLDEDEPISPISEPGENLNEDEAEEEVKVVDSSTFVLKCTVPSKKEWQIKEKNE